LARSTGIESCEDPVRWNEEMAKLSAAAIMDRTTAIVLETCLPEPDLAGMKLGVDLFEKGAYHPKERG
jgi:hypothetical protein